MSLNVNHKSINASSSKQSSITGLIALRIFLAFASGYFLSYALRSVNAALAPVLAADLHLSAGELGWLSSAYFLAFAAMQIPVGIWLDRYGARRTESALLLVAATGAALVGLGDTLWMNSLGRILIGAGVAPCLMASYYYFRRCFPAAQQPRLVMSMLLVGATGALVATQPALSMANWLGWRQIYILSCGLLFLSALAVYFLTTDADRQQTAQGTEKAATSIWALTTHPVMLRIIPACIFTIGGFSAMQTLWAGPWLTKTLGFSPEQASIVLLYLNASLMASYFLMGAVSPWLLKAGLSLSTQSLIALTWIPIVFVTMILWQSQTSWVCWLLFAPVIPAMFLLQTQAALAFPGHVAGRVLTTTNLMIFVGTFAVQWVIGLAVDTFNKFGMTDTTALRSVFACLVALQLLSLIWFVMRAPGRMTNAQA
jgi:predicted MFS family arabinose efflux permease